MLTKEQTKTTVFLHLLKFHDPDFFAHLAADLQEDPAAGVMAVEFLQNDEFFGPMFEGCDTILFAQLMYEEAKVLVASN